MSSSNVVSSEILDDPSESTEALSSSYPKYVSLIPAAYMIKEKISKLKGA